MTIHVHQPVSPEACPALVLNADYRPLSYYPLSLWCWQDAIKAVFLDRVNIVSELRHDGAQPELRDAPALGRVAEDLCQAGAASGLHPVQRVPARPLHLPVLRRARGSDLRPRRSRARRAGRPPGRTSSPPARPAICARATACPARSRCSRSQKPYAPTVHDLHQNGRLFPPNYLHESWLDYLYWDTELEP